MKNWIKGLIILAIGVLLGFAGTVAYIGHSMNRLWLNSGDHAHVLDRLTCTLSLTPDQKTKVEAVLKSEDAEVNLMRKTNRKEFQLIRDRIDARIRPLLTPEQVKKLDALRAHRDRIHPPQGFWAPFWFLVHPMPPPNPDEASAPPAGN